MPGNGTPQNRRRRVSYILPLPTDPLPVLSLPAATVRRPGDPRPLIRRRDNLSPFAPPDPAYAVTAHTQPAGHPQHRLGVSALALDLGTIVVSPSESAAREPTPTGILYAGGRDGLLSAWELGLPMRKRRRRYGQSKASKYARSVRWGNVDDEDGARAGSSDEEEDQRDAVSPDLAFGRTEDLLDDRGNTTARSTSPLLPYEERWEIDREVLADAAQDRAKSTFRQSVRPHADWINAIALCNLNRTVISASSDRTVQAWSPHDRLNSPKPTVLGQHTDYVKTLAAPRDNNWVASGGFDRLIKIWDLQEGRTEALRIFPEAGSQASVYSLATTPMGSVLASGSPENVVRLWDHRTGRQFGRLAGHADNIRCLLVSEDGSLLLSGSADSDIKLWSLREQRCIETFSYHNQSVWSLFSNHPYLDTFYSGDRSGLVCKVDMDGCRDAKDADCIVLLQEGDRGSDVSGGDGINCIVAADDTFVWTATGSSTIKRWRDVASRSQRLKATPVPRYRSASLSQHIEADPFEDPEAEIPLLLDTRRKESMPSVSFAEESTTQSISSLRTNDSALNGSVDLSDRPTARASSPFSVSAAHRPSSLRLKFSTRGVASDGANTALVSDIPSTDPPCLRGVPFESMIPMVPIADAFFPKSVLHGEPLSTMWSTRSMSLHRPASTTASYTVASPSPHPDLVPDDRVERQAREHYELREDAAEAVPLRLAPEQTLPGLRGLVMSEVLNDRRHVLTADKRGGIALWDIVLGICLGTFEREDVDAAIGFSSDASSGAQGRIRPIKETLAAVKGRIEGEDTTSAWSTVDVRSGCISVHLDEARVFEGEQYADLAGFGDFLTAQHQRVNLGKTVLRALFDGFINEELRLCGNGQGPPSLRKVGIETARLQRPAAPSRLSLSGIRTKSGSTPHGSSAESLSIALATPAVTPVLPPIAADQLAKLKARESSLTPIPGSPGSRQGALTNDMQGSVSASATPRPADSDDYFSSSASTKAPMNHPGSLEAPVSPSTAANSSLMGKLRGLGRKTKATVLENGGSKEDSDVPSGAATAVDAASQTGLSEADIHQLSILRSVFSKPLAPCPAEEAPPIMLPPHTVTIVAEESLESASWQPLYRGTAASMSIETQAIEMSSPAWLLDFLLGNRAHQKEPSKVAFVMTPWEGTAIAGLREMPEGNNRLSANRVLRIAKVAAYCADRLGGSLADSSATSSDVPRIASHTSLASSLASNRAQGESLLSASDLEILIGDEVIPHTVTLAQSLRFWQRRPGDLLLGYRLKGGAGTVSGSALSVN